VPLTYSASLGPIDRAKNHFALKVRRRVFELFMHECQTGPESRVADLGVSGHRDHPAHYFFEVLYPYTDHLTAVGQAREDADWYSEQFSGLTFLEADLHDIPLPDNYFDAAICNAVVEHAGTREQQASLVREVCRVSRQVLFTTPNKQFPIELHTFVPLVHWFPDPLFRAVLRRLGFGALARVETLHPLDMRSFLRLFPKERDNRRLSLGAWHLPTNLVCLSSVRETAASLDHLSVASVTRRGTGAPAWRL